MADFCMDGDSLNTNPKTQPISPGFRIGLPRLPSAPAYRPSIPDTSGCATATAWPARNRAWPQLFAAKGNSHTWPSSASFCLSSYLCRCECKIGFCTRQTSEIRSQRSLKNKSLWLQILSRMNVKRLFAVPSMQKPRNRAWKF